MSCNKNEQKTDMPNLRSKHGLTLNPQNNFQWQKKLYFKILVIIHAKKTAQDSLLISMI